MFKKEIRALEQKIFSHEHHVKYKHNISKTMSTKQPAYINNLSNTKLDFAMEFV